MEESKTFVMHEIQVDIEENTYKKLIELGREWIQDDEHALFNYAANKILSDKLDQTHSEKKNKVIK